MRSKRFLSMLVLLFALVAGTASAQTSTGTLGTSGGTSAGTTTTPGTPDTGLGDSGLALTLLIVSGIGAVAGALYLRRRLS